MRNNSILARRIKTILDSVLPYSSNFVDLSFIPISNQTEDVLSKAIKLVEATEKKSKPKSAKRKQFSKNTKLLVLISQGNRCKSCGQNLDEINFDHIDGNSSNNYITNCQALCPNCHAKKTRKKFLM